MEILYSAISFVVGLAVVSPYIVKLQNLLKEVADVIEAVKNAPEDGITTEDIKKIKKEANEVWAAVKAFKK